jgi:hypothetical protein
VFQDVEYTVDAKGRRTTENPNPDLSERHALFFGCSYTFGMGLPTESTLPSRFAEASKGRYRAYNYAVAGWGASQTYLILDDDSVFDDVTPASGIAIYGFIPDHLSRSTPYKLSRLIAIDHSPLFRLSPNQKLIGPFRADDDDDLASWMYWYARAEAESPLVRQSLRVRDVSYINEHQAMDIVVRLLRESSDKYLKRFPDGRFYVLIWPRVDSKLNDLGYLIKGLKDAALPTLRVPPLPDETRARIHPRDGHPSADEVDWVARQIQSLVDD